MDLTNDSFYCHRGHLLEGENVRVWVDKDGGVHHRCKLCARRTQRAWRAKNSDRWREIARKSRRIQYEDLPASGYGVYLGED